MEMDPKDSSETGITLGSLNLRPTPARVQNTIFGKVRAFNTFSIWEWVYLAVSFLALAASFGLTIQRLASHGLGSSDFTFAILLMLTIGFGLYYVIHSMFTERGDELLVFVVSNAIVLLYCVMNYIMQERTQIKKIRLIVVCVLGPFLIVVGIVFSVKYCRSNNLIFNTVGSIASLQKACRMFFWCSSLLKFDLQLQLSMLVLVMGAQGTNLDTIQISILSSGVVVTLIFFVVGLCGLRRENTILMVTFYILGLFEPAYVAYKFYYAGKYEDRDSATYESTFACGCFALVVWLGLMVCTGYFVTHHFGKGLKERMHGYSPTSEMVSPSSSVSTEVPRD